jgi:hypothetical protein
MEGRDISCMIVRSIQPSYDRIFDLNLVKGDTVLERRGSNYFRVLSSIGWPFNHRKNTNVQDRKSVMKMSKSGNLTKVWLMMRIQLVCQTPRENLVVSQSSLISTLS